MQLSIKDFYSGCEKKVAFQKATGIRKERPVLIGRILKSLPATLAKKGNVSEIIESLSYPDTDFEFPFLRTETEANDKYYLHRFCEWFEKTYHNAEVSMAKGVQMFFDTPIPFGEEKIEGIYDMPHLLIKNDSGVELMFLYFSEHRFFKNGRSEHTKLTNFLPFLLGKAIYEKHYPGIKLSYVSLKGAHEAEGKSFDTSGEKGANYHILSYEEENISVEADELKAQIIHILSNTPKKDCFSCSYRTMCGQTGGNIWSSYAGKEQNNVENEKLYTLPEFTQEQQEVINHKAGPLLMIAGPGSGKTAVLTARTISLVNNGVAPENILLIAFTNKAVGELEERIAAYMPAGRSPKVTTFNSLGFEILNNHSQDILGTRRLKVLTDINRKQMIYHLLSVQPKLQGFNYNLISERNGLVDTVVGRLEELSRCHTPEEVMYFKRKYDVGDDFLAFSDKFHTLCKAVGYITFDEQIELCVKYLSEHPQVLNMYHNIYQYVMVDEYQDCNEWQYRFIKLLAAHGNICVAGDDDQAIYEFRNASSRYMGQFLKDFHAKQILLARNFRCNDAIVTASKRLISPLGEERIEKALFSTKKGEKPVFVNKQDAATVSSIIEGVVAKGYSYGDIAILARTNGELTKLQKGLNKPCYLAKVKLTDDSLFGLMFCLTELYYHGMDNNNVFVRLLTILGVSPENLPTNTNETVYKMVLSSCEDARDVHDWKYYETEEREDFFFNIMSFISAAFHLIEQGKTAQDFCEEIVVSLGIQEASTYDAIVAIAEEHGTIKKFAETLHFMEKFGDSKMVETEQNGAIALYTSHSSKGKEFPVVIMTGCEVYAANREDLRLAYVGMTRAEDELYLLYDGSSNCYLQNMLMEYTSKKGGIK